MSCIHKRQRNTHAPMEEDHSKDKEDAVVVTHKSAGMSGLLACQSFETYEYHYVLCLYIQLFGLFFSTSVV